MPKCALVKGIRQHLIQEKRGKLMKRDSLCAYMAQMSGGNCAGGLFCRHLPACSTILFFPAALILRRAQHNPDRYITKGLTRVTFNFRLPLPVWCTSWDDDKDTFFLNNTRASHLRYGQMEKRAKWTISCRCY